MVDTRGPDGLTREERRELERLRAKSFARAMEKLSEALREFRRAALEAAPILRRWFDER